MTPEQVIVAEALEQARLHVHDLMDRKIDGPERVRAIAAKNTLYTIWERIRLISPRTPTVHCDSCSCPLPTIQCRPVDDWPISEVTG